MAIKRWTKITDWDDVDLVLDVEGLMRVLRIGQNKALELLQSGQIRATKVGKAWRISKEAVRDFLEAEADCRRQCAE